MASPRIDDGGTVGFTLVELLVTLALALLLGTLAATILGVQTSAARVHPAAADLAERARAAVDLVAADLAMAGAGVEHGAGAGPLACCLPVILPRRIGTMGADATTVARADRISVVFVPFGALSGTLRSALGGWSPPLDVDPVAPCPVAAPACGWPDGAFLLAFDRLEHHDYYRLVAPVGATPVLRPRQRNPGLPYAAGASVTPVETHTYYFDATQHQLRHYDGHASDVPAVDNVVAVTFSYEGEASPPVYPKPPPGEANCLYDATGARWPWISTLSGGIGNLVDLPLTSLADGPWCGLGDNRFDIDLLRIRRVRLTIRMQAPDDLRSRGGQFTLSGASLSARRQLPDMLVTIDITPRNLNAGR